MIYGMPDIVREYSVRRFASYLTGIDAADVEVRVTLPRGHRFRVTATVERRVESRRDGVERVYDILASGPRIGPMGLRLLADAAYAALLVHVDELYPAVELH